jgi:hypothetical protein
VQILRYIPDRLLPLVICFILIPLSQGSGESGNVVIFSEVSGDHLQNARAVHMPNGSTGYTVRDLSYSDKNGSMKQELVLSFNRSPERMGRDDTRRYDIRRASFRLETGEESFGSSSALFYKSEHGIEIETERSQWLGKCGDLGSFTLEFRLRPTALKDGSVLFSRVGRLSGSPIGFEVVILGRRIVSRFHNMFQTDNGNRVNIALTRGPRLEKDQWYHYLVTFDRQSGRMASYLNNSENETVYVTETGRPGEGVYTPLFTAPGEDGGSCVDMPAVRIGTRYAGYLDEVRLSRYDREELSRQSDIAWKRYRNPERAGRNPYNYEGIITSPVYSFKSTGTRVTRFQWEEKKRENTFIWMEFRIADRRFSHDDRDLKWYRVRNGERTIYLKKTKDGLFLRGKYYQWRAHLVPSPDGTRAPVIHTISLRYQPDLKPKPPMFIETVETGDRSVTLKWLKSYEEDIAGYRVYYGTTSGKYDGIIETVQGKPITNEYSSGDYITLTITNELVEENRQADTRNLLNYPRIRNRVLYFFTVSTYDTYRTGTPYNHESDLSEEVTGRPCLGSEITPSKPH